jgi:hypothetical protein
MTRRKFLILGALLTILVATLYSVYRNENAFHTKYKSIQVGMPRSEVEAILGPGKRVDQNEVSGQVILFWKHSSIAQTIYISFVEDRVAKKDFEDLNYL